MPSRPWPRAPRRPAVWSRTQSLGPGRARGRLDAARLAGAAEYLLRTTVPAPGAASGLRRRPPRLLRAPVARVLGIDAAFVRRSYRRSSARELGWWPTRRSSRCSSSATARRSLDQPRLRAHRRSGRRAGAAPWRPGAGSGTPVASVGIGDWPSGLYYARLRSRDGRVGFAPFVLRPALGASRVASCCRRTRGRRTTSATRTATAGATPGTRAATRRSRSTGPFLHRGVPPRFKSTTAHSSLARAHAASEVDVLADDDLERCRVGGGCARLRPRRLPRAHRVRHRARLRRRRAVPRSRRQPVVPVGEQLLLEVSEAWPRDAPRRPLALTRPARGAGRRRAVPRRTTTAGASAPFVVRHARPRPGSGTGPGLARGSTFGEFVGGFGTEIDARRADSPRGTTVVAEFPDLFGAASPRR